MMHTLYIKTHNVTGKHYLGYHGPTNNQKVENYKGSGKYWKNHIKEHGDDIKTMILCQAKDKDVDLFNERCKWYSEWYDVVNNDNFANLCHETGTLGTNLGYKHTQEFKDKVRFINKSRKGEKRTQETKDNIRANHKGMTGKKQTQDAKDKIGESLKGREFTQEHKDNLSKVKLGKRSNAYKPNSLRQIHKRAKEAGEFSRLLETFSRASKNPNHKYHQLVLDLIEKYTVKE